MRTPLRTLSTLLLAGSMVASIAGSGCAGRVRIYDSYHNDYHRWDHNEDLAYRRYLAERHEQYREFSRLNNDEKRDYWNWRHDHPDGGHRH